jgi:hypothetical protein
MRYAPAISTLLCTLALTGARSPRSRSAPSTMLPIRTGRPERSRLASRTRTASRTGTVRPHRLPYFSDDYREVLGYYADEVVFTNAEDVERFCLEHFDEHQQ